MKKLFSKFSLLCLFLPCFEVAQANEYKFLKENSFDPLLDDTFESPSSKFKNFDLIGIPYQIIIGSKMKKAEYEFKELGEDKIILSKDEIFNRLKEIYHSD